MEDKSLTNVNKCVSGSSMKESENVLPTHRLHTDDDERDQFSTNHPTCGSNPNQESLNEDANEKSMLQTKVSIPLSEISLSLESTRRLGYTVRPPVLQKGKEASIPTKIKPFERYAYQKLPKQSVSQCLRDMSAEDILKFWLGDAVATKRPIRKGFVKTRRLRKKKKKEKEQQSVHCRKGKTSNSSGDVTPKKKPRFRNKEIRGSCKSLLCSQAERASINSKSRLFHKKARKNQKSSSSRSSESSYSSAKSSQSFGTPAKLQLSLPSHCAESKNIENLNEIEVSGLKTNGHCVSEETGLSKNQCLSKQSNCYSHTDLVSRRGPSPNSPKGYPSQPFSLQESESEECREKYGISSKTGKEVNSIGETKDCKRNDSCKDSESKRFTVHESLRRKYVSFRKGSPYIIDMQTVLSSGICDSMSDHSFRTAMMYPISGSSDSSSLVSHKTDPDLDENMCIPFRDRKYRRCYSMNEKEMRSFKTKEFIQPIRKEISFSDDSYFLRYYRIMSSNAVTESSSLNDVISTFLGSSVDILCHELPFNLTTQNLSECNQDCYSSLNMHTADERISSNNEMSKMKDFLGLKPIESMPFDSMADVDNTAAPPRESEDLKSKWLEKTPFPDITFPPNGKSVVNFNNAEHRNLESKESAPPEARHVSGILTEYQHSVDTYQNGNVMTLYDPRPDIISGSASPGAMSLNRNVNFELPDSDGGKPNRLYEKDIQLLHFCNQLLSDNSNPNAFTKNLNEMNESPEGNFLNIQPYSLTSSYLDISKNDSSSTLCPSGTIQGNSIESETLDFHCSARYKDAQTAGHHSGETDISTVKNHFGVPCCEGSSVFTKESESKYRYRCEHGNNPFLEQSFFEPDPHNSSFNGSSTMGHNVPITTSNVNTSEYSVGSATGDSSLLTNENGSVREHDSFLDGYWQEIVSLARETDRKCCLRANAPGSSSRNIENQNNQHWRNIAANSDYGVITSEYEHEYEDISDPLQPNPFALDAITSQRSIPSPELPHCSLRKVDSINTRYGSTEAADKNYATPANDNKYEYLDKLLGQKLFVPYDSELEHSVGFKWTDVPLTTSSRPCNLDAWRSASPDVISNTVSEPKYEVVSDFLLTEDLFDAVAPGNKSSIQVQAKNRKGMSLFRWKRCRFPKKVAKAKYFFACACCQRPDVTD